MKFNIGCGWRNFGEDWVHIDGGDYDHLDSDDIMIKQYPNNCADLIYASHFIGYFDREEIVPILKRWRDVLKPGGIMRIATTDFETCARLYINGEYPLGNFLGPLYGKMPMGNITVYEKTAYDFKDLEALLKYIGMKDIKKYDWRQAEYAAFDDHSQAYLPHMDKDNGTLISLNVECKK